jgi:surfeit locus 1 family protein
MAGMTAVEPRGISLAGYRFAPRLIPTLAAIAIFVVTLSAGNWQTRRAAEKFALQQRLDAFALEPAVELGQDRVEPAAMADRRISVRGRFVTGQTLYIDNRVYRGAPGYQVVTPLQIEGGDRHVLINRGWIVAGPDRSRLPAVDTSADVVSIEGVAVVPLAHPYELAPDANSGPLRQNLVPERIAAEMKLAMQPVVVLQTGKAPDGLVRDWPKPDAGVNTHRAYALQWYVMAVLAVALWLGLNLKKTGEKHA